MPQVPMASELEGFASNTAMAPMGMSSVSELRRTANQYMYGGLVVSARVHPVKWCRCWRTATGWESEEALWPWKLMLIQPWTVW